MASPARDIRQQVQAQWPGASVVERRRHGIKHAHPSEPNRFLEVASVGPLHIAGTETEIDTAWITADPVADAPWQRKMLQADYRAYFGNGNLAFNSGMPFRYEADSGEWIQWEPSANVQWVNDLQQLENVGLAKQAVAAQIAEDVLHFAGAYGPGIDYEIHLQSARLQKRLVLTSALAAPPQFILDGGNPALMFSVLFQRSPGLSVWVDGQEWNEGNGQANAAQTVNTVEVRNAADEVVMYFDAAWARDYSTAGEGRTDVITRFRRQGGTYFIEFRVPWSWLETAVYPVVIDPTVNPQIAASGESPNESSGGNVVAGTNRRLNSSTPYCGIRLPVSVDAGATINDAYAQWYGDHPSLTSFDAKSYDFVAEDSCAAWDTGTLNDMSGRTLTGNGVAAQITLSTSGFTNTPSNVNGFQAIVDRGGFSSGNYVGMVFTWDDVDATGNAQYSSYEDDTSKAPKFFADYTAGGGGTTYEDSVGFGISAGVSQGENAIFAEAAGFSVSAGAGQGNQATLLEGTTQALQAGLESSEAAILLEAVIQGLQAGLSETETVVLAEAVTQALQVGLSEIELVVLLDAAAVGVQVDLAQVDRGTFLEAVSFAVAAGMSQVDSLVGSGTTYEDAVSFDLAAGMAASETVTLLESVVQALQMGLSDSELAVLLEAAAVGVQADLAQVDRGTLLEAETFAIAAGLSEVDSLIGAGTVFEETVSFDLAAGMAASEMVTLLESVVQGLQAGLSEVDGGTFLETAGFGVQAGVSATQNAVLLEALVLAVTVGMSQQQSERGRVSVSAAALAYLVVTESELGYLAVTPSKVQAVEVSES